MRIALIPDRVRRNPLSLSRWIHHNLPVNGRESVLLSTVHTNFVECHYPAETRKLLLRPLSGQGSWIFCEEKFPKNVVLLVTRSWSTNTLFRWQDNSRWEKAAWWASNATVGWQVESFQLLKWNKFRFRQNEDCICLLRTVRENRRTVSAGLSSFEPNDKNSRRTELRL